eukprot:scaffold339_cov402-Prasinococcus_capsulatus_cf.AAC.17
MYERERQAVSQRTRIRGKEEDDAANRHKARSTNNPPRRCRRSKRRPRQVPTGPDDAQPSCRPALRCAVLRCAALRRPAARRWLCRAAPRAAQAPPADDLTCSWAEGPAGGPWAGTGGHRCSGSGAPGYAPPRRCVGSHAGSLSGRLPATHQPTCPLTRPPSARRKRNDAR